MSYRAQRPLLSKRLHSHVFPWSGQLLWCRTYLSWHHGIQLKPNSSDSEWLRINVIGFVRVICSNSSCASYRACLYSYFSLDLTLCLFSGCTSSRFTPSYYHVLPKVLASSEPKTNESGPSKDVAPVTATLTTPKQPGNGLFSTSYQCAVLAVVLLFYHFLNVD